jgi:uncharacterized membrane protein YkvA (DUF1232 family)
MADQDVKFLDGFAAWLRSLGDDAQLLAGVLADPEADAAARQAAAGGLNYLFKSLDLIPDGIDDIGYLDDAFVLRVAAAHANAGGAAAGAQQLASDAGVVQEFLGDAYARLDRYVAGLRSGAARGRTVTEILSNDSMLEEFLADVRGFGASYQAPSFSREPKTLIKLRAFFDAKLPK